MPGIPQDSRSPFQQLRLIEIYNAGGSTIPAFGAIEVTGVTTPESGSELTPSAGRVVMSVRRPTCDSSPRVMFNLMNELPPGKYGVGTNEFPCWALSDTTSPGDRVGSAENSYILEKGKAGFIVAGGTFEGATRIMQPTSEVSIYDGTLTANLCSGSGTVDNLTKVGSCCDDETITGAVTAENKYNLMGCSGDSVLLIRACVNDEDVWRIIQVTHHIKKVLLEDPTYATCQLHFPQIETPIMHCCAAADESTIQMYEHTYQGEFVLDTELIESMDPQNHSCTLRLRGKPSTFCAFTEQTWGTIANLATLAANNVHVQLDTLDDGVCVQKYRQWIYTIGCAITADSAADIFCTTDCDTGSGS